MKTPMTDNQTLLAAAGPGSMHWVGDGFPVRNLFPSNDLGEWISPFLLFDYLGPQTFDGSDVQRGVGEHPHRGFETVTLMFEGRVAHRDSTGSSGVIGPGDVQWMTAGSGVVHEELHETSFSRAGGTLHGVQLWVNLPAAHKMTAPKYQDLTRDRIPVVELDGGTLRVIAGEFSGARGPASTFTPVELWDVRLDAGSDVTLSLPAGHSKAVVSLQGEVSVNESRALGDAEIAVVKPEQEELRLRATAESHLLVLGGEPLGEPVVSHGPFVMNTREEIVQAVHDYQNGKMGHLA